jgi:integrase
LSAIANQLHDLGFRKLKATGFRQKHVQALVDEWLKQKLSPGTIKNRMSCLRWWAEKVNKRAVVAGSNDFYGIPDRQFLSDTSKAKDLAEEQLVLVKDEHVRMSLRLQLAFGLRREEAIKIQPRWADRGDHLQLKASWTKGGRERTVPIRTREQRALLEQAKQLAGLGSLIPGGRQYIEQLRIYERHTANAGLSKMHGLRHAYAQQRYRELTGWPSPHAGGPTKKALTLAQQQADQQARLAISQELGHVREQITAVYLGR